MSNFVYAPDPPESALQADISSTATSMEVDTIPNGVSADDRVKCIIEQDHPHELVYGVVQTIGGGANGGTDVDMSASEDGRGKEGTSPASHTSGDVVIVGAGGRNDMESAGGLWPLASGHRFRSIHGTERADAANSLQSGETTALPIWIPQRTTLTAIACEVLTAGSSDNDVQLGLYEEVGGEPRNLLTSGSIAVDTIGVKTLSISLTVRPGLYFAAITENANPTTRAEFNVRGTDGTLFMPDESGSSFGTHDGIGWVSSTGTFNGFPDPWNSADMSVTTGQVGRVVLDT